MSERVFRSSVPDLTGVPFAGLTAVDDPVLERAMADLTDAVQKMYGPLRGDSQNEEMAADGQRSVS